jgi:hypothetical protein
MVVVWGTLTIVVVVPARVVVELFAEQDKSFWLAGMPLIVKLPPPVGLMTKLAGDCVPLVGEKKPGTSFLDARETFDRLTRYVFPAVSVVLKNPVVGL